MENQLFNLEKIKEITKPIEKLQGNVIILDNIYDNFILKEELFSKNINDKNFLNLGKEISSILKEINSKLKAISNNNVYSFLFFQDSLIKKYKESFKDTLKKLELHQNFTKRIGLSLIERKKISKIIKEPSYVLAISLDQWLDLLDFLKQNSLFLSTVKKCDKFYEELLEKRYEIEESKIPGDIDQILKDDFKNAFFLEPNLTFKEFLLDIDKKLTKEELESKKKIIEKSKESEKLEKLKQKQAQQRRSYEDYIKLSNREFERKIRKKKREKLSNLDSKKQKLEKLELSKEISEKIEKFKSKFNIDFEEKYFIQEDDEKNPIDVIRERKKRKEDEYKAHIKKIKPKKNEM